MNAPPARVALAFGLSLLWFASTRVAVGTSFTRLVPVALGILAVVFGSGGLPIRFSPRALATGLAAGGAMALLTYPAFRAAGAVFPSLVEATRELYLSAGVTRPLVELPALVLIVAAEELLWRAWMPDGLRLRVGTWPAWAIATGVYALAQLGSGSGLLALVALVCGTVWAALRVWTGSVWAPFACHLVWTGAIVVGRPLV